MKPNTASLGILMVVTRAVLATHYRVTTDPERIRQRQDWARTACLNSGGDWVKAKRDEICRTAEAKKL